MRRFMLMAWFITTYSWTCWAQEIYLEGVSVLGDKKVAYMVVDGNKVAVEEGEEVANWKVNRIERRVISLISPEGKETELQLNTNLKLSEEKTAEPVTNNVNAPMIPEIKDEDVPPGYRKVKTPFGDYVILKDYNTPAPEANVSTQEATTPSTETSPPETTDVVRTPFGDIPKNQAD